MTARLSSLGAVLYENETNFAEDTDTTATRLETVGPVDVSSLEEEALAADFTEQRPGEGFRRIVGPHGGSFSIRLYLTGHGAAPGTGALTATALYTLLGDFLGGKNASGDGDTAAGTGDAGEVDTSAATADDYNGWRIGATGDGRGNGQCYFVTSHAGNTLTLLNDMEAAASSSDAVSPCLLVHPLTLPASMDDVQSMRFLLQTANRQYLCHGCYPQGFAVGGINAGEPPYVDLTFGVAWWETKNSTFPATTAAEAKTPAAVAGGSFWFNSSVTHRTFCARDVQIAFNMQTIVTRSSCTDSAKNIISSVKHAGCTATLTAVLQSPASGTYTFLDHFEAGDDMRCMYTLSSTAGKAVGLWFRNLAWMSKPKQIDHNGQNAVRVELMAKPVATSTIDRAQAPWHLLMG